MTADLPCQVLAEMINHCHELTGFFLTVQSRSRIFPGDFPGFTDQLVILTMN